jgi:very-short-patch-repair endonuclease
MTKAERKLWARVRKKQILGIQFYRQKPIERFIVDFYAPKAGLVIEVDGGQHFEKEEMERDSERDAILTELGLTILRFDNFQVLRETDAVLEKIREKLEERMEVSLPLKKGG